MASRKLSDLTPQMTVKAVEFTAECDKQGLDILIYCTYRSNEEQARLYRQGRSLVVIQRKAKTLEKISRHDLAEILMGVGPQIGCNIVTYAAPGQSYHGYAMAFDGCPMRHGKPVWGTKDEDLILWQRYGDIARQVGIEWAGDWSRGKKEFPHCQQKDVNWRELIKQ